MSDLHYHPVGIPEADHEAIRALAEAQRVSFAVIVRWAIRQYLDHQPKPERVA